MASTTRQQMEPELSRSWLDWMGVNSPDVSGPAQAASAATGGFQPEEASALYREVFDALQVPRRLSGPRRVRRGPFEFASVFDAGEATFLALGDIAGKGLTAAMWSTHILGLIRTYSAALGSPPAILQAINRDLYLLGSVPLTTMVLAKLDWQREELVYSNAGHCAPVLQRLNGEVEHLNTGGPVLAAVHDAEFEADKIPFKPGDMLVSYSDGLVECRNQYEEEFGVDRLVNQVRRAASLGASKALFTIVGAIQDFAGGAPRFDDLTLMVLSS